MPQVLKTVEYPIERIKSGQIIFEEGSTGPLFYILRAGSVGIFRNRGKADEIQLATIKKGSVFGEISAIDGLPRTATAVALEDIEIVKVPSSSLTGQLKQCPGWFRAIIVEIVERLRITDELMAKTGAPAPHVFSTGKVAE